MKAISVQPPWATMILQCAKTVEWRSWKTDYRGDLLICSSSAPYWAGSICKHALCVVELEDIVPFRKKHLEAAVMDELPSPRGYAWLLGNLRFIEPFELKGKLRIYDVDDSLIKVQPETGSYVEFAERHYKPLMRWEDKETERADVEAEWEAWMEFLREAEKHDSRV